MSASDADETGRPAAIAAADRPVTLTLADDAPPDAAAADPIGPSPVANGPPTLSPIDKVQLVQWIVDIAWLVGALIE